MRRWLSVMALTCVVVLLLVYLLPTGGENLEPLAQHGDIQHDAPVQASLDIVIQAPVEKVWQLIAGIDDWPNWQTAIKEAHLDGSQATGTTFTWSTGAAHIHSRLALVVPPEEIAWTGTALNAHAIHVWKLERLPGNRTHVTTVESMSGFLLTWFYSSKDLQVSDRFWLERLKQEAER